ncbi:hypothetical protein [Hydrogenophaga defluvii]|uniref:hypothetical protein n=1 Tax=Hydrogenophaga defluvii TaxID=249410 RepID=UPI0036D3035F
MQHPSTYAGPRFTTQRARRAISPINAAQRAGYGLDAVPAAPPTAPTAKTVGAQPEGSTTTQAH